METMFRQMTDSQFRDDITSSNKGELYSTAKDRVKKQTSDFVKFVTNKRVIQMGIAFILSIQINQLANSFVENIVMPLVDIILTENRKEKLRQMKIVIFGVSIEVGRFIEGIIKFIVIVIIIFIIVKLTIGVDKF